MRVILLFILIFTSLNAINNKKVLILNSYHKGFKLSDTIIKNIEDIFFTNKNIDIEVLYMDAKQITSNDYISKLSELYKLQLKNRHYDLIITIDRFAYRFVVRSYDKLFTNEKVLFTGVETFSKELARVYGLKNKIYGIVQKLQIKEDIDLILKTIPSIDKLYILNDRSGKGNDSSKFIVTAISDIKDKLTIEYKRDSTLEELKNQFKKNTNNEAILFVRYSNAPNGKFYKTNEVLEAINSFQLPVFVTNDLFVKKGVVGGKIVSISNLAVLTANKAINILYNKDKKNRIETHNQFEYIFDLKIFEKYNLKIPTEIKNYKKVNAPLSFFQKYRELVNTVFILSFLLLIIIIFLILAWYSKLKTTRELKQRVEFDKVLLNSINSPIFWKDEYGNILDANIKFCELIDIPYRDIHNEKLSDFKNYNKSVNKILEVLIIHEENELKHSQFSFTNHLNFNQIFYMNTTQYIDSNSNLKAFVTIFTDITKEQELENQKSKQTQYMVQQSKLAEIGEIFSSIAHQWKSPLVAITALAQDLFYTSNTNEKEEDSYHINNIMLQVQYMTKTINEFQEFIIPSKIKTEFNIKNTINSLLNIVSHTMKYNYINITVQIQEKTNLYLYGYENELMQAILNIINNAKDALIKNKINNKKIDIIINNNLNYLNIDIIDNGGGIEKHMQDKIFIQYFTTKPEGHGIGLYMTKLIIENKLEGTIKYKNIDNGSSFRIKLKYKV